MLRETKSRVRIEEKLGEWFLDGKGSETRMPTKSVTV